MELKVSASDTDSVKHLIGYILFVALFTSPGDACTIGSDLALKAQLGEMKSAADAVLPPNSLEIFKRILECRDSIWTPEALGFRNVFFVDRDSKTGCEFQPDSQRCTPIPSETFRDPNVQQDLAELKGYTVLPGGSGRSEALILNRSPRDIINIFESESRDMMARSNKIASKCKRFVTSETVPIQPVVLPKTRSELAGFFAHEDFHLYQRKWKTQSEQPSTSPGFTPETFRLWERAVYHMAKFGTGSDSEGRKHLMRAKHYYLELKKASPELAAKLGNRQEGTAYFVDTRAIVLAENGCDLSKTELRSLTAKKLLERAGQLMSLGEPSEYVLGALASHAMEILEIKSWKDQIAKSNLNPLEILFANVEIDRPKTIDRTGEALSQCIVGSP